ncbi:MAG: hypothetical protein R3D34_12890 [Nitratireductor sp.]
MTRKNQFLPRTIAVHEGDEPDPNTGEAGPSIRHVIHFHGAGEGAGFSAY